MDVTTPTEQLVDIVIDLSQHIPVNEFGMVDHYYRVDYLMPVLTSRNSDPDALARLKEKARVPLYYADGFPTTRSGSLFWDRLDHESSTDYLFFQRYLDMSSTYGYRSIHVLARHLVGERVKAPTISPPSNIFMDVEVVQQASASPSFQPLDDEGTLTEHLRQLYVFNFWLSRSKAFDLVGYAAARRIREQRALVLEDRQFVKLSAFADKIFARVASFTEEDFSEVDPIAAGKLLKDVIGLQRICVGLPANGPASDHLPGQKDSDASTSIEDHLRVVAKKRDAALNAGDTAAMLQDETTTALAQELMMRMIRGEPS